jgi:hypothetical protein
MALSYQWDTAVFVVVGHANCKKHRWPEAKLQAGITVDRTEEDTRYYHQAPVAVIMLVLRGAGSRQSIASESVHRGDGGGRPVRTVQLRRPALRYMLLSRLCACIQIQCRMSVEYCLASPSKYNDSM